MNLSKKIKMLNPLLDKLNSMRVVLGSSAPHRQSLLENLKLKFEVCSSNFEENLQPEEYTFSEFVEETALRKVLDVWEQLKDDVIAPDIIIGVDTMVTLDGKMYGKPKSRQDAIDTITKLTSLSIPNVVYTGVAIKYRERIEKFTAVTTVYMGQLSQEEIEFYVDTGEYMGKAGGYSIQGIASSFVERIEGDFYNVTGLPLNQLIRKLKEMLFQ